MLCPRSTSTYQCSPNFLRGFSGKRIYHPHPPIFSISQILGYYFLLIYRIFVFDLIFCCPRWAPRLNQSPPIIDKPSSLVTSVLGLAPPSPFSSRLPLSLKSLPKPNTSPSPVHQPTGSTPPPPEQFKPHCGRPLRRHHVCSSLHSLTLVFAVLRLPLLFFFFYFFFMGLSFSVIIVVLDIRCPKGARTSDRPAA